MKKQKRCQVYYHRTGKRTFLRIVLWPDKTVSATKVRMNVRLDPETEKTVQIYRGRR